MSAAVHEAAIARLLADLGKLEPDGIADLMRAKGIKGELGEPLFCPLTRYIRAEHPLIARVAVSRGRTSFVDPFASPSLHIRVSNPASVAEFIRRFDASVYLDLVAVDG